MRLATFRDAAGTRIGVVRGERIVDIGRAAALTGEEPPAELREMQVLIAAGDAGQHRVAALLHGTPEAAELPLAAVELLAPIPRPRKNVFCLGRNYAEHA
ncbi:MAG: fumarylacetoacetate hydrolase family protein, partial [Ktedonobacterales bacterium]